MASKYKITAYQLKVIAIVAMTIDHIAWMWVPATSPAGQIMHTIGRITAPIMCYLLAEGYIHTHNVRKYTLRLGITAVISAFAFCFFATGRILPAKGQPNLGMIYTLFLALLALRTYDSERITGWKKRAVMVVLFAASLLGDWAGIGVIWPLMFYILRFDRKMQFKLYGYTAVAFAALINIEAAYKDPAHPYASFFQFGTMLALPLLNCYQGELGGKRSGKWFFYAFYPLHLVIIRLIAMCMQ